MCTSPSRALVDASIYDEFMDLAVEHPGYQAGRSAHHRIHLGEWWRILILGAVITLTVGALAYIIGRWVFGSGGTRLAGLMAGMQTQPALLAYANSRTNFDPRIALGYALAYSTAMVVKMLVATVLAAFATG